MPMSALNSMGAVTAPTRKIATEVLTRAEAAGHRINTIWGYNPGSVPEHSVGRALDFMCDRAGGDWIADYLWNNRGRLGLKWELWRQRIRSTSPGKPGTWQAMANRGNSTVNHMDHVHAFFDGRDPGAAAGVPAAPPQPQSAPLPPGLIAWDGTRDDRVTEAGKILQGAGFDRHFTQGPGPVFTDEADGRNLIDWCFTTGRYPENGYVNNVLTTGNFADLKAYRKPSIPVANFRNADDAGAARFLKMAAIKLGAAPDSDPWCRVGGHGPKWAPMIRNLQAVMGDRPDGDNPFLGPQQVRWIADRTRLFNAVD